MYKEYSATAQESHVRVVGRKFFTELFHKLKFSVLIPRKDQCDVCVGEKHGNVSNEEYDPHIKLKDEARDEKTKDKEAGNDKIYVWTMDMQAVLLYQKSKASSLYYKTKLVVHNFMLYNLKTKEDCECYEEEVQPYRKTVHPHNSQPLFSHPFPLNSTATMKKLLQ